MADNEKGNEEESGGGSNKKMIIIIAIVVILTIGLSVGVTIFLLNSDDGGDSAGGEEEVAAEPVDLPAIYFDIKPPFVVAINVDGKQRYLQIHMSVMGRQQSAFDVLDLHMPLIRNKLILFYSSQDFEYIQTNEGKEELRAKSKEMIQEILTQESEGDEIEQVLFTNFVMQ